MWPGGYQCGAGGFQMPLEKARTLALALARSGFVGWRLRCLDSAPIAGRRNSCLSFSSMSMPTGPSLSPRMRRIFALSRLTRSICFSRSWTCLMDDILRFVSFVNWHLTLRLEHSEQLVVSVASHLTFLSRQASQLGSLRRCRYALFCP